MRSIRLINQGFIWKNLMLAALYIALNPSSLRAQHNDPPFKNYQASATKIHELVHTKLEVKFDYKKRYLYGKGWITLKPYFYPTDSLHLDAKGMDIKQVSMVKNGKNSALKFTYDSLKLAIKLDKTYQPAEKYTVYIDYTSKPDEFKTSGSEAISDAKGLYFINPDSAELNKPVQIWTQGETESSSMWFPTIDKPNQKSTSEISMTVPAKYVTLSNGKLTAQKKNIDGTRTDTWEMDLPHAPYLFMMAVGDFKIYKDKWKDKEISYYLEPAYAPYAKDIFGYTPEMLDFFSNKLGIEYPWNKYAQIVVRDYVSGAMENTTASVFGDFVHATDRELLDKNQGEGVIAHELFHHWFGDYVTAESWSNLTVNESFADLSETLWAEYKHGKDAGDDVNYSAMQAYLGSEKDTGKNLVRFHYDDKEDMFDLVSYQKGGRILNMLRNYLGEEAFYKGVNIYLKTNAFKTGEAHQLRLAFEEASGKDLNWFFNQWFFGSGHPSLQITYRWNEATKTQSVYINQVQQEAPFTLPIFIDLYAGGKKERLQVWLSRKSDTLNFKTAAKPDLVNIDGDKILLAHKTDNKTLQEYAFQYFNAGLYTDRLEAIDAAAAKPQDKHAHKILLSALTDKYEGLRLKTLELFYQPEFKNLMAEALPIIVQLMKTDKKPLVQAAALKLVAPLADQQYQDIFDEAMKSRSYSVQAAALTGITFLNPASGMQMATALEKDSRSELSQAIANIYIHYGDAKHLNFISNTFNSGNINQKFNLLQGYVAMMARVNDTEFIKTQLDEFSKMAIQYKSSGVGPYLIKMLEDVKRKKNELNSSANDQSLKLQIDYIDECIGRIKKSIEE
jgi:aminopeptidase N